MYFFNSDSLQFCVNNPHFCKSYCNVKGGVVFFRQKEVNGMKRKNILIATLAKKAAESALRRDANRTTCAGIYQPKVPSGLKHFKNVK